MFIRSMMYFMFWYSKRAMEVVKMVDRTIILSRRIGYPSQNKRSRSGSMLILILVILAVALILITSALMISMAGRQRFYRSAEQQQAGLTAMSAAKMIGEAAANNDITPTQLEFLATNKKIVRVSSDLTIPGLSGNSDASKTEATFGYFPKDSTSDTATYVTVTVKTTIDAGIASSASDEKDEKVTILLQRITITSKAFQNLITLGISGVTDNNLVKVAVGDQGVINTNGTGYTVVHGDIGFSTEASGSQTFNSDVIFTDHLSLASGSDFYGNIIFYGNDASLETNSSGHDLTLKANMTNPSATSNLLFLRSSYGNVFTNNGGTLGITVNDGGIYLLNSDFRDASIKKSNGVVYGTDSTANIPATSDQALITELTTLASNSIAYVQAASSRQVLTKDEAEALLFSYTNGVAVSSVPTSITNITNDLGADYALPTPTSTDKKQYYIDTSSNPKISNTLSFDLAYGDIELYIIGGSALVIDTGAIRFVDSKNTGNIGKIFLLDGSDIVIDSKNNKPAGIYGRPLDPLKPPFVFIYGNDNNQVNVKNGFIEGYIGLYGLNGTVNIESTPSVYSRIEAAYIINQKAGAANTPIPYCPLPAKDAPGSTYTYSYIIKGYDVW